MSMKSFLRPTPQPTMTSLALLLLRVVAGLAFMFHGWGKIQHPMDWMGPAATTPGFLQALAAISEFVGGAGWILGLLFPIASLGIGCTMAFAVHFHAIKNGDPFVASGPGQAAFEPALVYLCIAILFLLMGPGMFALDKYIFRPTKQNP